MEMKKKSVSIKDVAKVCNVSVSTVSRVLHKYPNVPPETEKLVMSAVKKLNYIPNTAAQSLIKGSLKNIGVVFTRSAEDALVNPFFADVLRGIGSVTQNKGYYLQLLFYKNAKEEKKETIRLLRSGRLDGVILLVSRVYDDLIYSLIEEHAKFVLSGRVMETMGYKKELYTVNTDNVGDSYKVIQHLIQLGHEKIVFINGPREFVVNEDRYAGYRKAFIENGIDYDPHLEIQTSHSPQSVRESVIAMLKKRKDVTAIFAKDDLKAIAAIQAIKSMGLRVPEDIAVIGFNDYDIASMVEPKLTTVRVPIYEMGKRTADMLINQIEQKESQEKTAIFPTELILRESCGHHLYNRS